MRGPLGLKDQTSAGLNATEMACPEPCLARDAGTLVGSERVAARRGRARVGFLEACSAFCLPPPQSCTFLSSASILTRGRRLCLLLGECSLPSVFIISCFLGIICVRRRGGAGEDMNRNHSRSSFSNSLLFILPRLTFTLPLLHVPPKWLTMSSLRVVEDHNHLAVVTLSNPEPSTRTSRHSSFLFT